VCWLACWLAGAAGLQIGVYFLLTCCLHNQHANRIHPTNSTHQTTQTNGAAHAAGKMSYVPQTPWCQNLSLRDNILFGNPMERRRYDDVISACALGLDLEILPQGDESKVGVLLLVGWPFGEVFSALLLWGLFGWFKYRCFCVSLSTRSLKPHRPNPTRTQTPTKTNPPGRPPRHQPLRRPAPAPEPRPLRLL
jgi:hypothetical protein